MRNETLQGDGGQGGSGRDYNSIDSLIARQDQQDTSRSGLVLYIYIYLGRSGDIRICCLYIMDLPRTDCSVAYIVFGL